MKVIIPVAGLGSRLKPHTFTTPKPLMKVAGKPIIDYVLTDIKKLKPDEIIIVVGYYKEKIKQYVDKNFSQLNCKYVEQEIMDGDGGAIRLALKKLKSDDELYIIFGADTLIDFDLKKELKKTEQFDAMIFGKRVKNPSNYGIMNLSKSGEVIGVEEKPKSPKSNLAIIGAYYFKSAKKVKELLDDFYRKDIKVKNEFKLVQVVESYIKDNSLNIGTIEVKDWFDCGRIEVLLEANRYFLEKNSKNKEKIRNGNSIIIPPCYIPKSAKIDRCIIGPYVSIGKNTELHNIIVKNSILGDDSKVENFVLEDSLVGKEASLYGDGTALNLGDKSEIRLK